MGMYDSFIDRVGREWQTKELDNALQVWRLGDNIDSHYIPQRGTVNVRVYDFDEHKKQLVYATVRITDGIVKSIRPDKEATMRTPAELTPEDRDPDKVEVALLLAAIDAMTSHYKQYADKARDRLTRAQTPQEEQQIGRLITFYTRVADRLERIRKEAHNRVQHDTQGKA
ncbi:hypothetical protein [Corynebacterium macclintockiae]|uniref:hypothetical protein n=2 Tax=Corynebacterium macclintockiae TaxID=2913501 RepID=UPI003EBE6378